MDAHSGGDAGPRSEPAQDANPRDADDPATVVVMGVSGTGKSTIAVGLADLLGFAFLEGDQLHPVANIERMTRGVALTDADRWPWLQDIARHLAESARQGISTVATCSSLRRAYRDVIREAAPDTFFLHLSAPFEVLEERIRSRAGHFMPPSLLKSQFSFLEPLGDDENGAVVDVTGPPAAVIATAAEAHQGAPLASPRLSDAPNPSAPCDGAMKSKQSTARPPVASAEVGGPPSPRTPGVEHPSIGDRAARGRAARAVVPRSSHGEWQPRGDRPDPVGLLEEQAANRVPELVPLRYTRMLESPFTFYRGAAYLMASDLAPAPRTGLTVQLCGDAHLSNFGTFLAPDRTLVFGINDFDETLPGPFEWDVKRMVASFAVAGRDRGFDAKQRKGVNLTAAGSYRQAMGDLAGSRRLDVWYARLDIDEIRRALEPRVKSSQARRRFEKNVARAAGKDSLKAFKKLVHEVDGQPRLVSDPPLIVPLQELLADDAYHQVENGLHDLLRSYRRSLRGDQRYLLEGFRFVEAARKVVGVGSVGTRAWIVLMLGNGDRDPLFLQAKEAEASVLEPFLGRSKHANHGQRVVEGQRLLQSASDILLGWVRTDGVDGVTRDFYVRQLWDGKGSAIIEAMTPSTMTAYAQVCGWTLARAHARSGDALAIARYLGGNDSFDQGIAAFAESYADQNERDYAALKEAVDSGLVATDVG